MTSIHFFKYQGTGNDFIMIDNRTKVFDRENLVLVRQLCDRKFGVGADGLILIEGDPGYGFEMVYFNSDGSKSFCGNGSRCAVAFAHHLGMIEKNCTFLAIDGPHTGEILPDGNVAISVRNVEAIETESDHHFLNTGSPHYIQYVKELDGFPVVSEAQKIRYNDRFRSEGTNVNFIQDKQGSIRVRTYERGVEDETLSCGSGVTACAISYAFLKGIDHQVRVQTEGGELMVNFRRVSNRKFEDIRLVGPAVEVFKGSIDV